MTVEEAWIVLKRCLYDRRSLDAARAYGDARELKGHVEVCGKAVNFGVRNETLSSPGHTRCGQDGWLCDKAKKP